MGPVSMRAVDRRPDVRSPISGDRQSAGAEMNAAEGACAATPSPSGRGQAPRYRRCRYRCPTPRDPHLAACRAAHRPARRLWLRPARTLWLRRWAAARRHRQKRWSSLMRGASGTLLKCARLSLMILVNCIVVWLNFAYSMISRCTRSLSASSCSRRRCSRAMRLSMSCSELSATRRIRVPTWPVRSGSAPFAVAGGRNRGGLPRAPSLFFVQSRFGGFAEFAAFARREETHDIVSPRFTAPARKRPPP